MQDNERKNRPERNIIFRQFFKCFSWFYESHLLADKDIFLFKYWPHLIQCYNRNALSRWMMCLLFDTSCVTKGRIRIVGSCGWEQFWIELLLVISNYCFTWVQGTISQTERLHRGTLLAGYAPLASLNSYITVNSVANFRPVRQM